MKTAPRSEQAGAQGYQIGLRSGSMLVGKAIAGSASWSTDTFCRPSTPRWSRRRNGSRAAGSLPQTPTGDGDTKNAKRTVSCSDPEVAPSSSAHVARLSRRGPGHGPRGTSTGSQVARDGSYVWYRSRYGYMSELENRKRRGPPHGPSRRIAPEASRPPVEACVQTHGNAVTAPLWPVAPPPGGWVHPGTYPGVYHTGLRPRGAAWGPHEPRIRGVGVWGGLGPMWNTRLCLAAYIF